MAKQTNTYPDWAEKFRDKGRTIRKVKNGYALYECTSEYVKGGLPKSKQKYLGMITEKDGFIPKKTSSGVCYLEYGLSRLVEANLKRAVMRHVFKCTDTLFRIGIIQFIFGSTDDLYFRSSYLTYSDAERYIAIAGKLSPGKAERVSGVIRDELSRRIPDPSDREKVHSLLMLCVVEAGPRSVRRPEVPEEVREILEHAGMRMPD